MPKKKPESFEELCERLEQIVRTLEEEQVSLEQSLRLFEEGVQLAIKARGKLQAGERKVRQLIQTLEGGFELKQLEE